MAAALELSTLCPFCKRELDRVVCVEGSQEPGPGDITMCFKCGEFAVFGGDPLTVGKPTDEDYIAIGLDPECRRMREAWVKQKEASDNGTEPEVESVLDLMFEPVRIGMIKRDLSEQAILSTKAAFCLGCSAALHLMRGAAVDGEKAAMLERLEDEVRNFKRAIRDRP